MLQRRERRARGPAYARHTRVFHFSANVARTEGLETDRDGGKRTIKSVESWGEVSSKVWTSTRYRSASRDMRYLVSSFERTSREYPWKSSIILQHFPTGSDPKRIENSKLKIETRIVSNCFVNVSFVSDSCDIGCRPVGHGVLRERGNEWGGDSRRV